VNEGGVQAVGNNISEEKRSVVKNQVYSDNVKGEGKKKRRKPSSASKRN